MGLTLGMVTIDTQDARELGRWWADQTGGELEDPYDGWFVTLKGGGLPVMLAFQRVDDPTPGKNKVHPTSPLTTWMPRSTGWSWPVLPSSSGAVTRASGGRR
jgi:hypothetical protein